MKKIAVVFALLISLSYGCKKETVKPKPVICNPCAPEGGGGTDPADTTGHNYPPSW